MVRTILIVAAFWIVSDIGFYYFLPLFGQSASYNAHPFGALVYYALWISVALMGLRPYLRGWDAPTNRTFVFGLVLAYAGLIASFAILVPPQLPPVMWTQSWSPPDIMTATPWYFLPKSVDILFQQILLIALVRALWANGHSMKLITLFCAVLFGGSHLLLVFDGMPDRYVLRFTFFATAFALLFPVLILRVRNGAAYSYGFHWVYYAVTIVTARTISPYVS